MHPPKADRHLLDVEELRPAEALQGSLFSSSGQELGYPSGNPRLGTRGMIADSALQAQNLEVTDERDAIVAVEATGRYSGVVG